MRKNKQKEYYVTVYKYFPILKWKRCSCCGEEVKLEKIYEVTFRNDIYYTYQKPFLICKKCALKKIIGDSIHIPILERAIPRCLAEYYETTEEFKEFKKNSNKII